MIFVEEMFGRYTFAHTLVLVDHAPIPSLFSSSSFLFGALGVSFLLYSTRFVFIMSLFIKNYSPFMPSKTLILFPCSSCIMSLTTTTPAMYFHPSIHGEFSSQHIPLSHYTRGRRKSVFFASTPIVAPLEKITGYMDYFEPQLSSPSHSWNPGHTYSSPLYLYIVFVVLHIHFIFNLYCSSVV